MKQLSGADHMWLTMEEERKPMHILGAAVCRMTPGAPNVSVDHLIDYMTARLGELPLRRRLIFPPMSSDLAYWLEDPDFDITQHVHKAPVPTPGHWSDALATLTTLAEERLDRSRPLWQLYLLPDLDLDEDGEVDSFVVAYKVHHAQFDGTSLVRLINRLYSPAPTPPAPAVDTWQPDEVPDSRGLLARAGLNALRRSARAAQLMAKSAIGAARGARSSGTLARRSTIELSRSARTRFAASVKSPTRVFDALEWPLAEVKAMRTAVEGATVNDVALTIIGGALQKYLTHHNEPVRGALVAWCPVVVDQPGRQEGNFVSMRPSDLHADQTDPLERLKRVRAGTAQVKEVDKSFGISEATASFLDVAPMQLMDPFKPIQRLAGRLVDTPFIRASGLAASNVPGSPDVLYFDGHEITRLVTCAFLTDGLGLLMPISSYRGELSIGFQSAPELLPDPRFFMDCLREAYDELRAAAIG